jgi:alginate O-acetyltransferase complex protein AlgI
VFFAAVLLIHRLPLPWAVKKANLLLASYLFYAAWNPPFVLLLWFSTAVDWFVARRLHVETRVGWRRLLLLISLGANLGLLAVFKYGEFLMENTQLLLAQVGVAWQPAPLDLVLPVGISFYTFQTLAYSLDVYLRRAAPARHFLDYALFVTFFPQLVAGPIVRPSELVPQFEVPRASTRDQLGWGGALMVLGLFEKVVLADVLLAPAADAVFAATGPVATLDAWLGVVAFAAQIFCDFAGYSTIAIGAALALGFSLPDNFRMPYAAVGFSDFWRRWHISLSTWLRDYLYIPLGGNRHGAWRTYGNLMTTMLLGGLWHGASWTFVVWGGLHGLYLAAERIVKARWSHVRPGRLGLAGLGLLTFVLVNFTWVFFRAQDFATAARLLRAMVGWGEGAPVLASALAVPAAVAVAAVVGTHIAMRERRLEEVASRAPGWLVVAALVVMSIAVVGAQESADAFIYFQF